MDWILDNISWALTGGAVILLVVWCISVLRNAKQLAQVQTLCKEAIGQQTGEPVLASAVGNLMKLGKKTANVPCIITVTGGHMGIVVLETNYAVAKAAPVLTIPKQDVRLRLKNGKLGYRFCTVQLTWDAAYMEVRITEKLAGTNVQDHDQDSHKLLSLLNQWAADSGGEKIELAW